MAGVNNINLVIEKANDRLKNVKKTIVVMSGKGGVGKSTVAVNLAVSLALEGRKVGLLDVDLHGPDVARMLGGREEYPYQVGEEVMPPEVNGIKFISMSHFLKDQSNPVVWRGPLKTGAIMQFVSDISWGELDYLVVDCPPGTGDESLTIFQNFKNIQGAVIVTTPSDVSQDDVEKAINFVKMMKHETLGLVENMSYFVCDECKKKHYIFGKGGAKKLAEKYNLEVLQEIPLNASLRENMDNGKPAAYFGTPEMVAPFTQLAKKIIAKSEI
ncbi:iron-sulfur cluster carrier protein [Tepiditoga spiralis]|uniref:Iron-sulfur cluster carrier protein n=1 Tax=Tepiditoga spiralis TaxID=2108365 RepID=A0A7G1G508_9BACT|nr:Mrp/NBP35 family ATP-binding protein [Tepiditoga spiralis]BBE29873.1 iron-sulfur cluster carrier protein [Tepiditoga spiralis]